MSVGPSTEQLLVKVLVRSMLEVLQALTLEGEGSDARPRDRAVEELELAFAQVWGRIPFLELGVGEGTLEWNECPVLEAEEDHVGFTDALAAAGIDTLTLVPGVEDGEAVRFLTALHRARSREPNGGTELLTLLFREDLQHVRYSVIARTERALPTSRIATVAIGGIDAEAGAASVRDTIREEAARAERTSGVVRLEEFDSTLYFLDQREIEYLRSSIDREYAQDHAVNALALLLDILQLQTDPDVRREVIAILEELMPYLLDTGRFEAVAYLISEVRTAAREGEAITPDQKASLDALRASVSRPDAIDQLFHALEHGRVEPTPESLGVLLRELRPRAIRRVLGWLGELTRPEAEAAVGEALDAFFEEWPMALSRMLAAPDKGVVHAALELAARLKLPDFVDAVAELADDEEGSTRAQVARTLAAIGSGSALRRLVPMAEDAEPEVRIVVYRTLAERAYRGATRQLERALASGDLERRGLRERRALFEAYGAVAGAEGVTKLERLLKGRSAFGQRPSSETRACAAVALGVIGTPSARAALQHATDTRDPMVRSAASSALRGDV